MSDKDREMFERVIRPDWCSSESECEEDDGVCFRVYGISWRSRQLVRGLHALDTSMVERMSNIARKQYIKRIDGDIRQKKAPENLPDDLAWVVKK